MFREVFEAIVRFGSEGELANEVAEAKREYIERTGELFETDPSFEQRLALFLEWYALDRPVRRSADGHTPVELYMVGAGAARPPQERRVMESLSNSTLSLFEFRRAKPEALVVVDLLTKQKLSIYEQRRPAGLEPGDILEARVLEADDRLVFSEAFGFHPRGARRTILKAAKRFRKSGPETPSQRHDFVHRVAYFSNRCERYRHVDPQTIFAPLVA